MNLTSLDIISIVRERIVSTSLGEYVPTIYLDHYPQTPSNRSIKGEFIVINTLSNAIGEGQAATVNVNIYVPDLTPRINAVAQRQANEERLAELTRIAYDSLKYYPTNERWYFDVSSEMILKETDIPYSFANLKITLKKY
jgi:hypothetical protein